jgi:hypothetical protein
MSAIERLLIAQLVLVEGRFSYWGRLKNLICLLFGEGVFQTIKDRLESLVFVF